MGYYLINKNYRNYLLLFASLIFFAWGGVSYTIILIGSITMNYIVGLQVQKHLETRKGYWWLLSGVTINILLLFVFKYTDFIISNLNALPATVLHKPIVHPDIVLPIGISFYTFHSISYLVDIYRRKAIAQRNIFDLSIYIAMFSQLIAGPIIRYGDVWQQLRGRTHSASKFSYGVERFLIGLGKKVLLANTFGRVADTVFATQANELCAQTAWLGIVCYGLQLYTDFSGYSDMAIGLGRMFGFEFLENFNFPYISRSIAEFWRRWHISLSSWINDYIYTPLSISMRNWQKWGIALALNITFFLAGLWHGANWTFVVFGMLNGLALTYDVLTKKLRRKVESATPAFLYNRLSIVLTLIYWSFCLVFFRSVTIAYGFDYMKALFWFHTSPPQSEIFISSMTIDFYLAFVVTILGSAGFFNSIGNYVNRVLQSGKPAAAALAYCYHVGSTLFYAALLFLCSIYLIAGTYNPFIYYRF
jgi:alginate O-acetyltransferase complex protein AlgI